jgi:cyclic pyranopterin phosphate synthase
MVDVGEKAETERRASARARVRMCPATAASLAAGELAKGDAVSVARVAGIMAAKRTPELIPLCHPVGLGSVELDVAVDADGGVVTMTATVQAREQTGVEMEALVAASTAALACYDMVKGVERGAVIEEVALMEKTGGVHGSWQR